MENTETEKYYGKYTGINLNDTKSFEISYIKDDWGFTRPCISKGLLALSAELSAASYDLDIEQWWNTNWKDFSYVVGDKLYTYNPNQQDNDEKAVEKTRSKILHKSLLEQFIGTIKQKEENSTVRALIMTKKLTDTRFVIAIGFMGTGDSVYDWISNFKFSSENGIHKGFHQLTKQFMSMSKTILFPSLAKELGEESLTLEDIIQEATLPFSRFVIWSCGHSQGAAILQLMIHMLIKDHGVYPKNIIGYGFASPLVMMGETIENPGDYPIYHILNSDDHVPMMGGQIRLGIDLLYIPTENLREKAYLWRENDSAALERAMVINWFTQMVDMPTALLLIPPILNTILSTNKEDQKDLIDLLPIPIPNNKIALKMLEVSSNKFYDFIMRRLRQAYISMMGSDLPQKKLEELQKSFDHIVEEIGAKAVMTCINEVTNSSHRLLPFKDFETSAYIEIIKDKHRLLAASLWNKGNPPQKRWMYNRNFKCSNF